MESTSPLRRWIKDEMKSTDGKIASAARVSRATVQAAAAGDAPLTGRLREFLLAVNPQIVTAQDAYRELRAAKMLSTLQAA